MKQRLINFLLKWLLDTITVSDIINTNPKTGITEIDGKPITQNEIKQLQAEAKAMEGFRIWELMSETTKHEAEDRIFNRSVTIGDINFGKAMLYNLSLQKSIIKVICKL